MIFLVFWFFAAAIFWLLAYDRKGTTRWVLGGIGTAVFASMVLTMVLTAETERATVQVNSFSDCGRGCGLRVQTDRGEFVTLTGERWPNRTGRFECEIHRGGMSLFEPTLQDCEPVYGRQ